MPLVFERDGFKFAFYSNDHRPIHVHVRKGGGEAIFDVEDAVELRESFGLKIRELTRAQELAEENRTLSLRSGMNTLADRAKKAIYRDGHILIEMDSGVEVRFPASRNPRLAKGTPNQLNNIEISPFGLHWPDLDEDLSFRGLLEGNYGQNQKTAVPLAK